MKCRHPGLNFACTQRRDGKFPHTPMHVCTLTPPQAHSGSLAWLSIRLTHQAGEAKSDPAVKVPQHASLTLPPSGPPEPSHTQTHSRHLLPHVPDPPSWENSKTAKQTHTSAGWGFIHHLNFLCVCVLLS